MALIVEDGTGVAGADGYVTVDYADTYFSQLARADWAVYPLASKQAALRKGAAYLGMVYAGRWKGSRVSSIQPLDWPRTGVELTLGNTPYTLPSDVIPAAILIAQCELASTAMTAELIPSDPGGVRVKRQKVDVLEIEYADSSSFQTAKYPAIDMRVAPYLSDSKRSASVGVVERA